MSSGFYAEEVFLLKTSLPSIFNCLLCSGMLYSMAFSTRFRLSEAIKRIEKGTMMMILPGFHYKDTLKTMNCPTLAERRKDICLKTSKKISEGGNLSKHLSVAQKEHAYL